MCRRWQEHLRLDGWLLLLFLLILLEFLREHRSVVLQRFRQIDVRLSNQLLLLQQLLMQFLVVCLNFYCWFELRLQGFRWRQFWLLSFLCFFARNRDFWTKADADRVSGVVVACWWEYGWLLFLLLWDRFGLQNWCFLLLVPLNELIKYVALSWSVWFDRRLCVWRRARPCILLLFNAIVVFTLSRELLFMVVLELSRVVALVRLVAHHLHLWLSSLFRSERTVVECVWYHYPLESTVGSEVWLDWPELRLRSLWFAQLLIDWSLLHVAFVFVHVVLLIFL